MSKEVKARVLLVKVPKEKIGLFTALIDGSGRYAIVRTREKSSEEVYLIATPDTFSGLLEVLEGVRSFLPELNLVGEVESIDVG
ncbi:DUF4911 domain-containing protein [Pampinifervens florentissimum]|uniref:DUF4911 domain-containing protein n=1 Tax=Pampinifervens florentissimum TaxID=1632019 RepID=UPI0013B49B9E|nr:DUF4911 domain-containing protein [Hydrogenobacter sp. T-8]QID33693.1 DUF4911 domain-containing protein [Hydrogenobacter sp. T-8]